MPATVRENAGPQSRWCAFAHLPQQHSQADWMYDAAGKLDKGHLVENYAPLVKRIAFQLMAKLPASVDVDDLIQNGMIGLRENDWLPRSLRRDMRRIEAAIHALEQQHGRPPSETELAESLGVPLAEY